MHIEYEAKFFIQHKEVYLKKLQDVGAVLKHEKSLLKRALFVGPKSSSSTWLRIRSEFGKVFVTYKELINSQVRTLDNVRELQIEVSSYDDTVTLFACLGYEVFRRVENYRQVFIYKNCEITLDEWPGLPLISEIEGPSAQVVLQVAQELGFSQVDAQYMSFFQVYEQVYGLSTEQMNVLDVIDFATIHEKLAQVSGSKDHLKS